MSRGDSLVEEGFTNEIHLVRVLDALSYLSLGCTEVLKIPLASSQDRSSLSQEWCEPRLTFSTVIQVSTEEPISGRLSGGGRAGPGSQGYPTTPSGTRAAPFPGTTLGIGTAAVGGEMVMVHSVNSLSTHCVFSQMWLCLHTGLSPAVKYIFHYCFCILSA